MAKRKLMQTITSIIKNLNYGALEMRMVEDLDVFEKGWRVKSFVNLTKVVKGSFETMQKTLTGTFIETNLTDN
jgi:hypothetical protein